MIFADLVSLRKGWDLPLLAEPQEIAGLRRVVRLHLNLWGPSQVSSIRRSYASQS